MSESIAKWFRSGNIVVLEGMVEKREKGIERIVHLRMIRRKRYMY